MLSVVIIINSARRFSIAMIIYNFFVYMFSCSVLRGLITLLLFYISFKYIRIYLYVKCVL